MYKSNHREAQFDLLITRSIFVVVGIVMAGFLSSLSFKEGVTYGLINLAPVKTFGEITEVLTFENSGSNVLVYYEFVDLDRGEKFSGQYLQQKQYDKSKYEVMDSVEILSFRMFPEYNVMASHVEQLSPGFYIFLGSSIFMLILLLVLIWNVFQYNSFKESSKRY